MLQQQLGASARRPGNRPGEGAGAAPVDEVLNEEGVGSLAGGEGSKIRRQALDLRRPEAAAMTPPPALQDQRTRPTGWPFTAGGGSAEMEFPAGDLHAAALPLPDVDEARQGFEAQHHYRHHPYQPQEEGAAEAYAGSLPLDAASDAAKLACPPGSTERGQQRRCGGDSSITYVGGVASAGGKTGPGHPRPKDSVVDLAGDVTADDGSLPSASVIDAFDESYGLQGTTPAPGTGAGAAAAAAAAAAAVLASAEVAGGMRSDLLGGRGGGGGGGSGGVDGDYGMIGGAVHVALAFAVLVLVAFAKAGDDAIRATTCGKSAGGSGSAGSTGSGTPSRRRGSRNSGGGGRGSDGNGDNGPNRRSGGAGSAKRRKIYASKSGRRGGGSSSFPVVRHLRAAWSKLWHLVEDDLASRWHAAGQTLASLREAWSALWMPPPHPEADVLAEALASPPRYSQGAADRRRRTGGGGGGAGGGSERRKRRSGRVSGSSSSSRSGSGGGGGRLLSAAESGPGQKKSYLGRPVGLNCLNFLSLCGYRPGGGRGSRKPKFLLLLDLDETLVHCSPQPMEPARRRSGGRGGGALRPDIKLEMRARAPSDNRPSCMYAWKRPHLDIFLGVVSRWYEVAVFTSGRRSFAEPLIDLIDSRCVIGKRYYRDSCVRRSSGESFHAAAATATAAASAGTPAASSVAAATEAAHGSSETVKDLRRVVDPEHFPHRAVLVDNQPRTVVQQANVLPVRSWFPRDSGDRQLLELLPVLLALTSCQDVRSVLGLRKVVAA